MLATWSGLIPLILGSALEPIEIAITIMLLGTPSGVRAASSWIAGHGTTRLLQGLIFGTILHWGSRSSHSDHAHHWIVSTVLLVVALLFLVTAARELFSDDDPNAPPPKWTTMLMSATPTKAFFIGAGVIGVSVKAWVFTLAAISVIGNGGLDRVSNIVTYVAFVVLATGGNLLIVGVAAFFPGGSRSVLERMLRWLQDNNRPIMVVVGLGFGIWFGVKALHGFGIL
ncbi:GAP family protein [Mycobacterium sp.]|uniref:GAP family protein n=1 Tax=Mycobacterium sp. TaxID=1785 RepID=UPI003C74F623